MAPAGIDEWIGDVTINAPPPPPPTERVVGPLTPADAQALGTMNDV